MSSKQNWCKHYNGYAKHEECRDGQLYDEFDDICSYDDRPCTNKESTVPCLSKVYMTEQEAEEYQQRIAALVGHLGQAHQLISKQSGGAGTIECPKCGGKLHWSRAGNGHVWGGCETDGCLRWMQRCPSQPPTTLKRSPLASKAKNTESTTQS
jgi:hypothetical protein